MKTERFISLKEIINRIHLLGGDIVDDVSEDDVLIYTSELIGVVGMPELYTIKEENLEIIKYKAPLPCDFIEVRAVKCCDTHFNVTSDMFDVRDSHTHNPTYKIQGDYIVTSIEKGYIKMSYTAIKLDDEGYPMIIDNQPFIRALVSYIIYKKVYTEYINGRLPNASIMEKVDQEYEFNIRQATMKLKQPSMEEFDNVVRMMNSFIFRNRARDSSFKDIGDEPPRDHRVSTTTTMQLIRP